MSTEAGRWLDDAATKVIDRALTKTITHLAAMAVDTPYSDDPRWSPWTRFQKPLAERCRLARDLLRGAEASSVVPVSALRDWINQERARNIAMYRDTMQSGAYAMGHAHLLGVLAAWLDEHEATT